MLENGKMRRMIHFGFFHGKSSATFMAVTLTLLSTCLFGQNKNVTTGNQQWVHYFNQTRVSDEWSILADGGFRWKDEFLKRSQYIVRVAGAYFLAPNIRLAAGFAHLGTFTDVDITAVEFRPHQEITIRQNSVKPPIRHRIRVEQRFIETTSNNDLHFNRFNWRFRYFIGISIPIIKQLPSNSSMSLHLNAGDEIFINAGKDIVYNVFDQNRVLVGPVLRLNPNLAVSMTYNGKFTALNLPREYTYNHIIWLRIRHQIDLAKNTAE
jgi:hypothetical protein